MEHILADVASAEEFVTSDFVLLKPLAFHSSVFVFKNFFGLLMITSCGIDCLRKMQSTYQL